MHADFTSFFEDFYVIILMLVCMSVSSYIIDSIHQRFYDWVAINQQNISFLQNEKKNHNQLSFLQYANLKYTSVKYLKKNNDNNTHS